MHRVLRVINALSKTLQQPTCIDTVRSTYAVHAYSTFLPWLVQASLSNSHLL